MSKILLIDNYDSFVYNLARYIEELGCRTEVVRNDAITLEEIRTLDPNGVILSPGPCTPSEAGISLAVVAEFHREIPLLGVCLGHQAIAAALGGQVVRAPEPMHGRTSQIYHSGSRLLGDLPSPFPATRYHSLIVEEASLPQELQVTARTAEGLVMGLEHRHYPVFGVQFHPESVLSTGGHLILKHFLEIAGIPVQNAACGDAVPEVEATLAEMRLGNLPLHW